MAEASKLNDIIRTSLESIRNVVDVDTIIGTPIDTSSGTVIIPVSKVSIGFASGGLDYNSKNASQEKGSNFGGGGGTGMSVSPLAFIVIKPNGDVSMLNVNTPTTPASDPVQTVSEFIDKTPEFIEKIKTIFNRNKKKEKDTENEEEKSIDQKDE